MQGKLYLFGNLKLTQGDTAKILDTGSPKTQSLLAYCALHPNQPIQRRQLAFAIWSRTTESAARRNLRQYLHRLRQVLEPFSAEKLLLDVDGGHILFNPDNILWTDVVAFEEGLSQIPTQLKNNAAIPAEIWDTIDLYRGTLAPDIYDDWIEPLRTLWAQKYTQALHTLIDYAQTHRQNISAVHLAERLLSVDPLRENSHRLLMECYYQNGDRSRALLQFEKCRQLLQDELDADPMPETLLLYNHIRQGAPTSATPAPKSPPSAPKPKSPEWDTKSFAWHTTIESNAPPFIARQSEIAQLDQALSDAQKGKGQFLLIQGESGIGKTRLVRAWVQNNIQKLRLLSGQSREFDMMISYHPLTDVLSQSESYLTALNLTSPPPWLNSILQISPELRAHFSELLPPPVNNTLNTDYLSEGLGRFLMTLAHLDDTPLLIVLEDLHWADEATWRFLAHIAWQCKQAPLIIIGTCQSEYLSVKAQRILQSLQRQAQIRSILLNRFSPEETRQLAVFLMDDPHPARTLLSRLYKETEGNPFFVIETVNAWLNTKNRKLSNTTSHPHTFSTPQSVKLAIETRLNRLNENDANLLSLAAAIGYTFNYRILAKASDLAEEAVMTALETWLSQALVVEATKGYDFCHEKIREVAYQKISRARRRVVHRQVAQAFEAYAGDTDLYHPARIAHHYGLSDHPNHALPYLIKAGEMALAVRSYHEAKEFGVQAMRLLRKTPPDNKTHRQDKLDLNLQLATAYAFSGEIDRALPVLQEAERLAESIGDEARLGHIFHRSAQLLWLKNQCRPAESYARRLLRNAEEQNDNTLRYAALRMLGRLGIALSTYDDAIAYLLRYVKLDDSIHPPSDIPVIYGYLAVVYARVGAWQRAFDAAKRGTELADNGNSISARAVSMMNLAFIYAERQHWSSALTTVEAIAPLCDHENFTAYCFMARAIKGRAMSHLGQADTGIGVLRQTLADADAEGYRVLTHLAHLFLAESYLQAGQSQKTLNQLDLAAPLIAEADDSWARAIALRLQAEAQSTLAAPDWSKIEAALITATNLLRQIRARPDLARTYLQLRRLYDRAGQSGWAIDCHFRATTIFEELDMIDELQLAQGDTIGNRQENALIDPTSFKGLTHPEP